MRTEREKSSGDDAEPRMSWAKFKRELFRRGLSIREFAKRSGIPVQTVYRWRGQVRIQPHYFRLVNETLEKIPPLPCADDLLEGPEDLAATIPDKDRAA